MKAKHLTLLAKNPINICVPSPVQELHCPLFERKQVRVFVKREDLIHPEVSGNKWRKLKYNLQQAQQENCTQLVTFGGAFSNHIAATAAAGHYFGFKTIGVIRGEEQPTFNTTLAFAQQMGMTFDYVSREAYRQKDTTTFLTALKEKYPEAYFVPEGGSNAQALPGLVEMCEEIKDPYDYLMVACGTGGTLSGIVKGFQDKATQLIGVPVLKNGGFIRDEVQTLLGNNLKSFELLLDYHFGGYAKVTGELVAFKDAFESRFGFLLDPVYTAKLFYALTEAIKNDYFQAGSSVLCIHTGGLQGNAGMEGKMELLRKRSDYAPKTFFD